MQPNRFVFFAAAASLLLAAMAFAQTSPYPPPIDLPGAEMAADPHVIRVDGVYYLYPTASTVDIECWSSTDLATWTYEGVVWEAGPAGSWNDANVWAPDVFVADDAYYLYYTANNKIGLAVADSPLGPFEDASDRPLLGGGNGGVRLGAIDAFAFRDPAGGLFLYYVGFEPFNCVRVVKMIDPYTVGPRHTTLVSPDPTTWTRFVAEGPWIFEAGGVYYLMFSGNGADLPGYAVGYATAAAPAGPFTEYAGNPILSKDPAWDFYGPGHNSVVPAPDGGLAIVYHTKTTRQKTFEDRRVRVGRMAIEADGTLAVLPEEVEPAEPEPDDSEDDDDDGGCG